METVTSADGTTIAYERSGDGPPLVIVTGAFCDRATPRTLAERLSGSFTVYAYDRRGRGDSGDTQPYRAEREYEDLAAVIGAAGGAAAVFGHSSGAALALKAAAAGVPMTRLAAYEAPLFVDGSRPITADLGERIGALLADDRRLDAVRLFMTDGVLIPAEAAASIEHWPDWPGMSKIAHTLPYDLEICGDSLVPTGVLAEVGVPTLVLGGGNSPEYFRASTRAIAAAIPGAAHAELAGQDHGAADDVLAPVLVEFLG
jgi:pimeloyl-ACP methyl ester carboxylesterase